MMWVIVGCVMLYIGSYMFLSSRGCYVPAAWGLSKVKWYMWAPQGFASGKTGTKRNRLLERFYLPLWVVDIRLLHPSAMSASGRYPVNTTLDKELERAISNRDGVSVFGPKPFGAATNQVSGTTDSLALVPK
jgi:hypothetical protein